MTCEHCGSDAVDARGVCRACGWVAAGGTGSSPSFGETRAAEAPALDQRAGRASGVGAVGAMAPMPPLEHTENLRFAPPATATSVASGTSRFCGTCGARISLGEAFCGQCGAPVNGANDLSTSFSPNVQATGRYPAGNAPFWSPAEADAPTEMFSPAPGAARPYVRATAGAAGAMNDRVSGAGYRAEAGSRRALYIALGVVCLVGSVFSAAGAIFYAVAH